MGTIKKIYLSIASLLLMTLVFGTVTYAWISLASINNLDGLSLSASTGEELQISLDGINYSSVIPTQELLKITESIALYDVTTYDGMTFYTGGRRAIEIATPNHHYLSIELYFQTSSPERDIYLINNVSSQSRYDSNIQGTYVVSRGVQWRARHTFQFGPHEDQIVEKNQVKTYYASDAIRVGFIELKDDNNESDTREVSELIRYIFDPTEDETMSINQPHGATDYYTKMVGYTPSFPSNYPETSYRLSEISPNNPYQALDNESLIMTLQPTGEYASNGREIYRGKVRVNVWVEGWDANSFDAIASDRIKIQLQFKALRRAD